MTTVNIEGKCAKSATAEPGTRPPAGAGQDVRGARAERPGTRRQRRLPEESR